MADYFPSTFFFLRNSCYVIFRFNKFPRATSWLSGLGHFNQHFSLSRRISFFFSSRSDVLKVTAAVAAIYPPTGWPRPRFLDQSPYTPHFVMFCLTLPFVCTAPDFSLSLCIQCFPRVFLVSSCCGEAVAQFLIKT